MSFFIYGLLVAHPVMCDACHKENFTGFRYRCQKCHSYQLCQDCFWRGKVSGTHNNDHETREYSSFVCWTQFSKFLINQYWYTYFILTYFYCLFYRNHRANKLVIPYEKALDAYLRKGKIVYRDFQNSPRKH